MTKLRFRLADLQRRSFERAMHAETYRLSGLAALIHEIWAPTMRKMAASMGPSALSEWAKLRKTTQHEPGRTITWPVSFEGRGEAAR